MRDICLVNSDFKLSSVCFGTASFGEAHLPERLAFRLLDTWRDFGGNIIDTANVYGRWVDGTNLGEKIIGAWLAARGKASVQVATKCCHWDMNDPATPRVNAAAARADIEESLRTLGLDCVDICWLHRDDENKPVEEIIGFCEDLRRAGLIRYYGLSNWSAERITKAYEFCASQGYKGLVGVQNGHAASVVSPECAGDRTMLDYTAAQGDFHRKTGIAEFPYSAIGNGAFCRMDAAGVLVREGKIVSVANEGAISADFAKKYFFERNLRRYEILKGFALDAGISVFEACVAFHTSRDYTDIPVIATSKPERVSEIVTAADKFIPREIIAAIEAV